jgi:hypothetical protein
LEGLEPNQVHTLIIDEVDLTLYGEPERLQTLFTADVEVIGFSASLNHKGGGHAELYLSANKVFTFGAQFNEESTQSSEIHMTLTEENLITSLVDYTKKCPVIAYCTPEQAGKLRTSGLNTTGVTEDLQADVVRFRNLHSLKVADQHAVLILTDENMLRGTDFRGHLCLVMGATFSSEFAQL